MKKILIVEDDPIMGNIYRTRLEKEGYDAEVVTDGQAGFYRIQEVRPDAVLLDLMLPKINGVEILKKIRAQKDYHELPIIVFTNAYVPNMIQEAYSAGATHVFNKATLTPRQIIDAIHNAVNGLAVAPPGAPAPDARLGAPHPGSSERRTPFGFGEAGFNEHRSTAAMNAIAAAASTLAGTNPLAGANSHVVPPRTSPETDTDFQADLLNNFIELAPETLAGLRRHVQDFTKAQSEPERLPHLLELYRRMHALTGSAGVAGLHQLSRLTAAIEVLLRELHDKPRNINVSTLRTVANSVDFIGELFARGLDPQWNPTEPVNIMVVDDEVLSRRAILYALEKAGLKATSVEDPHLALSMAQETAYDLVFLDIQMPGMDGFDLCTKIHALPANQTTPIVFVTSLTDLKSRARSSLSGGADLIAKPFMFIELSVKALTYVLRGQLAKRQEHQRAA